MVVVAFSAHWKSEAKMVKVLAEHFPRRNAKTEIFAAKIEAKAHHSGHWAPAGQRQNVIQSPISFVLWPSLHMNSFELVFEASLMSSHHSCCTARNNKMQKKAFEGFWKFHSRMKVPSAVRPLRGKPKQQSVVQLVRWSKEQHFQFIHLDSIFFCDGYNFNCNTVNSSTLWSFQRLNHHIAEKLMKFFFN